MAIVRACFGTAPDSAASSGMIGPEVPVPISSSISTAMDKLPVTTASPAPGPRPDWESGALIPRLPQRSGLPARAQLARCPPAPVPLSVPAHWRWAAGKPGTPAGRSIRMAREPRQALGAAVEGSSETRAESPQMSLQPKPRHRKAPPLGRPVGARQQILVGRPAPAGAQPVPQQGVPPRPVASPPVEQRLELGFSPLDLRPLGRGTFGLLWIRDLFASGASRTP